MIVQNKTVFRPSVILTYPPIQKIYVYSQTTPQWNNSSYTQKRTNTLITVPLLTMILNKLIILMYLIMINYAQLMMLSKFAQTELNAVSRDANSTTLEIILVM